MAVNKMSNVLFAGLDIPKHGEPAYPIEAYGHGWEEKGDTLMSMMKSTVKSAAVVASPMGKFGKFGKIYQIICDSGFIGCQNITPVYEANGIFFSFVLLVYFLLTMVNWEKSLLSC